MNEMKPIDVVLTFMIHVLAAVGAVALGHFFFPGNVFLMFVIILFGQLLINWHKSPQPQYSVIGLVIIGMQRGKKVVQTRTARAPKLIDTLPPEEPKKPS